MKYSEKKNGIAYAKIIKIFSKIKFLLELKLNFNGGQFYNKILNFGYFKKLANFAVK